MIDEQVDKHLEQFAYIGCSLRVAKMDDYLKMIGDVKGMRDSMPPDGRADRPQQHSAPARSSIRNSRRDRRAVEEELKMAEQYKMELDKIKEMVDVEAVSRSEGPQGCQADRGQCKTVEGKEDGKGSPRRKTPLRLPPKKPRLRNNSPAVWVELTANQTSV